jgi:hypothetical protein
MSRNAQARSYFADWKVLKTELTKHFCWNTVPFFWKLILSFGNWFLHVVIQSEYGNKLILSINRLSKHAFLLQSIYEIKVVYAWTYMPGGLTILECTSCKWQWSMNSAFTVILLLDASSNMCHPTCTSYIKMRIHTLYRTTNLFTCRDTEKYETPNTK